jgi:membrane protease YdiL (CAAX protease family)
VLAYVTHRTGRLGPAIVAHMAFNLVTVVFLVTS